MDEKRLAVALFGVAVGAVVAYLSYRFVAALTVSVFLYYSTRRFHRSLRRLRLPVRVRAAVSLSVLAIPLLLLISYAVVLLVIETRRFVDRYAVIDVAADSVGWLEGTEDIPELTVQGLYEAYRVGRLDLFIEYAADNAPFLTSLVSGFFLNVLVITVVTYYLLVDGSRIRRWLLRFDEDAVVREYLEAVDDELEAVLFGNLLNVIAVSLIAVGAYVGYNAVAPAAAAVPYPALAGALTGIASLIPVVGMKSVYVPLSAGAAPTLVSGDQSLMVYVVGFLFLAIIVVDTIPDLVLRPYLSGETTHVGLLMLAYVLGPVALGFYGLFLAPILLVIALTFADTALPRLLGASADGHGLHEDQLRLSDFPEATDDGDGDDGDDGRRLPEPLAR